MFMLTLKSMRSIDPEYAIRYVTGRKAAGSDDDTVHRFKSFLDPNYSVPETSASDLGRSVDEAIVASETRPPAAPDGNGKHAATVVAKPVSAATVAREASEVGATPAVAQRSPVPSEAPPPLEDFKQSRVNIRVKLLGIITGIIIASLVTMIFLASGFFREDSVTRIQENNLNTAQIISQRVEAELQNIGYKSALTALTLDQGVLTADKTALFTRVFFQNNKDFIYLGVADRAGDQLAFRRDLYNPDTMESYGLTRENIRELHESNREAFLASFNGAYVVHNASQGEIPLIGISLPLGDVTRNSIIVVYLEPAGFLKTFSLGGIRTVFMVDDQGDIIAHPESAIVLARQNMLDVPIVSQMLEATQDNGLSSYEHDDVAYMGSYQKLALGGLGIVSTVPQDQALAAVQKIAVTNLLILGIVIVVAFLIVYFFSKTITVPILDLVGATRKIEQGDYSVNIAPTTRDEIGRLTHSFASMAGGLAERERIKDAMVKFVNKQVAELALKGEIKLGGEEKEVAVFFSDLRGFTAMSEGMTPEEVVGYLNEYFTGMVDCVNKTHGIVDKFIGDAVMAHWGAFGSVGNDTENAINGALMMRRSIIEFNERGAGERPFAKMGCGINTGPVVSGQIGSEERFEFTVIGDAVNLASRIEALNKPFGTDVLISQDSYDKVKDIFKVEAMPSIKVKGKTEPQVIYAVIGRFDDPDCPENMDQVREMLGIEFDRTKTVDPDAKEEKFQVIEG